MICPGYIKTSLSVNAATSDGNLHGVMDENQENGMPAADCAKEIVKAIEQNKEEVYIGGKELKGILFKRFFPKRFSKYMKSRA